MSLEARSTENFPICTLIYVWKQYFQLLRWHKIVSFIIIYKYFFLKTGNLVINWLVLSSCLRHMSYWKTILNIVTIHLLKARWLQKSQFSNCLVNLEVQPRLFENPNFSSLPWIGENVEVYTSQGQHFKMKLWIYGWIGKIYALI